MHAPLPENSAAKLATALEPLRADERLILVRRSIPDPIVFTTSFGLEDQVILHLLFEAAIDIDIVTIDTGRLFPEVYDLWAESERRYRRRILAVYPRQDALQGLIGDQGINGFYDSREARHRCCHVRKVEPLARALSGANGWLTGLRSEQSPDRAHTRMATADAIHQVIKVSPLFDWTRDAVADFARKMNVPINPLHEKGFVSIGCAPCTRAIRPGEDERAGRWWWETDDKKECGLHTQTAGVR